MFCRLKVRSYVLAAIVAGALKVALLRILKFPIIIPQKFEGHSLTSNLITGFTAILTATCANRTAPHYTLDLMGIIGYNSV